MTTPKEQLETMNVMLLFLLSNLCASEGSAVPVKPNYRDCGSVLAFVAVPVESTLTPGEKPIYPPEKNEEEVR